MLITRIKASIPIAATTTMALLLLVYVSYGEALRMAPNFEKQKLQAQGELIQTAVESFLQAGLPLKQFIGFEQLARPILQADPSLAGIAIRDTSGEVVFSTGTVNPSTDRTDNSHFRKTLELNNKFERVGSIEIASPTATLSDAIATKFRNLSPYLGAIVGAVFLLSIMFYGVSKGRARLQQAIFGLAFICAALLTTWVIAQIYSEGIQSKTHAMANSLASRLGAVTDLELNFKDISGIDRMIAEYKTLNPDIKSISVNFNDRIRFNSDTNLIGEIWHADESALEHLAKIHTASSDDIRVSVSIAKDTVNNAVLSNIRNFGSLFIATGFVAILIIQLSNSLEQNFGAAKRLPKNDEQMVTTSALSSDLMLDLIKPVYFIGVFVETLNASFLPQFLKDSVASQSQAGGFSALLFSIFFITFALVLVPAGRFAKTHGSKPLLLVGALMSAIAQALLAMTTELELIITARALSGAGQGLFLIGIQSFILQHASRAKTTQGSGIIVYGFNGGMISGAAIGSLLSVYMGISGVLYIASTIALTLTLYVFLLVPGQEKSVQVAGDAPRKSSFADIFIDIFRLFRDLDFTKTILFVGIPTKAVLTGVAIYALPLILAKQGYENDSIGQIIMFYAGGVLISSHFVSRLVDKVRKTALVLLIGTALSSIGLLFIGSIGFDLNSIGLIFDNRETYLAIAGMFVLGISHGFINAPVVTHVSETPVSIAVGKQVSVATYRLLERIGHVCGPIIVANLLFAMDENPIALAYIGGAVLVLGLLFALPVGRKQTTLIPETPEQGS